MRDRGPNCIPIVWPLTPMCQSPIVGQGADPPQLLPASIWKKRSLLPRLLQPLLPPPLQISPTANKSCRSNSETIRAMAIFQGEKKGTHKTFLILEINWVSPLGATNSKFPAAPNPPPQHSSELSPNPSHVNQSEDKAGNAFQPPRTNSTIGSFSCACLQVPQESSSH